MIHSTRAGLARSCCLLLFINLTTLTSFGQSAGIRSISGLVFSGYTLQDQVNYTNGYGLVKPGFQWGVGLEAALRESKAVAFVYQRMDTRAELHGSTTSETTKVAFNYFMASGTHYQAFGTGLWNLFLSVDVGAARIEPKDVPNVSFSRFAWGLRLGTSVGDRLQGRLYGQLYSPVRSSGTSYYWGSAGSGVTISNDGPLYQFNIGVGLSYRLNQ